MQHVISDDLKEEYIKAINQKEKKKGEADITYKRRFSLEDDFMNWQTDDLLFGFMRSLSTARKVVEDDGTMIDREYLPIKKYKKSKKIIASICGCSTRTIDRHLEALSDAGLIDEGLEIITAPQKDGTVKETVIPCFWFPYDYSGTYAIIEKDIVQHLVYTRNSQAIKIFIYLYNKHKFKKNYIFTIEELGKALGYAETTQSYYSLVKTCLASFKAEGLLNYEKITTDIEKMVGNNLKIIPLRQMKLTYICEHAKDLPNF